MNLSEFNIILIKKHLRNIFLFLIGTTMLSLLSFFVLIINYSDFVTNQMRNNIYEYNEIDKEHLCRISECEKVYSVKHQKEWNFKKNKLEPCKTKLNVNLYHLINTLYITNNNEIFIYEEYSDSYYKMNLHKLINDYIFIIELYVPFSLIIFVIMLYIAIKQEQEESIVLLAGTEALLSNKSMISITENIHHELNTPLEVIDNKIEKIHRTIDKYITREFNNYNSKREVPLTKSEWEKQDKREINKELIKLTEDFDFIRTASEQIYSVLEKMKGFKHLRYSNGNKTLKDIIDGGFRIINISNSNFTYRIDNELENYNLIKLKNADLLSIILNHLKNSLEANADKIVILFISYNVNELKFRIIDNGNGIPEDFKKNVFKPNFSTKSFDTGVRGNGMYLNKHILNNANGNVELISSSNKGTTMEITILANRVSK